MDQTTPQAWRAREIGTLLWRRHPKNHLVATYRADRGEAVEDFCTDLAPILYGYAVANRSRSMHESFTMAWWNYAALRDTEGSIYVLANLDYPDGGVLLDALEQLEEIILEVDRICGGCGQEMDEGSRVIAVQVHVTELRDPRTSTPGEKPDYFRGQVCSPACLAIWAELWPALNTSPQPT
jgi:hypothetical protein